MAAIGFVIYNAQNEVTVTPTPNNEKRMTDEDQSQGNRDTSDGQNQNNNNNNETEEITIPESWTTFEDSIIGYSIKHPENWNTQMADTYSAESTIESFERQEASPGQVPQNEIKIAVRRFIENAAVTYSPPVDNQIVDEKEVMIAGERAIRRTIQGLGTNISVEIKHDNETFIVTAYPADSAYLEEFDTMLKTFSFIPSVDIENPAPLESVSSPINISGNAPGNWFFEAQLSVELQDQAGEIMAETSISTDENWMTTDQVPFSGIINYENPNNETNATLVIRSANPSGLPEKEKSLSIPLLIQ